MIWHMFYPRPRFMLEPIYNPPPFSLRDCFVVFGVPFVLAYHGYRKQSLSTSGAIAAFLVGVGACSNPWPVFPTLLLVFYFTGSRLTKLKAERKRQLDDEYKEAGQRNATQVACNAAWGAVLAVVHRWLYGGIGCIWEDPVSRQALLAYVGHFAACNADTWASEIGILSSRRPRLITTLREVPPGTNGGVSLLGLVASLGGGAIIGLSAVIALAVGGWCESWLWRLIPVAAMSGLTGSLIDSFLGATVQKSLYSEEKQKITTRITSDVTVVSGLDLLDNNQVNFVASLVTSVLTAKAYMYFIPYEQPA